MTHRSFSLNLKTYYTCLLVFVFMVGHLLPYISHGLKVRAQKTPDIVARYNLLTRAGYLDPLAVDIYYQKTQSLFQYFKETANLESFYSALENLKKAQRLNRYFIDAYWLESDLYYHLLQQNVNYAGLPVEILLPLAEAEKYDPLNPFLKMRKAEIYLQFNRKQEAGQEAVRALELEPDYAAALYFLHKHFQYFPDDRAFEQRMDRIRAKAAQYQPEPGTYLYELFKIPGSG